MSKTKDEFSLIEIILISGFFLILIVLFGGEPDLMDAIINWIQSN